MVEIPVVLVVLVGFVVIYMWLQRRAHRKYLHMVQEWNRLHPDDWVLPGTRPWDEPLADQDEWER